MPKVSVVVPVYNVAEYIARCAESLFRQTLDDVQFIFVNNETTDNSMSVLLQTLERFPHCKKQTLILHQAHSLGIASARAKGLEHAEAPYVILCDSDDYMEPDMCRQLYDAITRTEADMVICDFYEHHLDGIQHIVHQRPTPGVSPLTDFLHSRCNHTVWCRIVRTDICRQSEIPTKNYFEEWVQSAEMLVQSRKVVYLPVPLYHYVHNPYSITQRKSLDEVEQHAANAKANFAMMHDYIMQRGLACEDDFLSLKRFIRLIYIPMLRHGRCRRDYLDTYPETDMKLFSLRHFKLGYTVRHFCIVLGGYPWVAPLFSYPYHKNIRMRDCFRSRCIVKNKDSKKNQFNLIVLQ